MQRGGLTFLSEDNDFMPFGGRNNELCSTMHLISVAQNSFVAFELFSEFWFSTSFTADNLRLLN